MHLYNKVLIVHVRKYGANIWIAFGRNYPKPPPLWTRRVLPLTLRLNV
jgi:hypothetical protein